MGEGECGAFLEDARIFRQAIAERVSARAATWAGTEIHLGRWGKIALVRRAVERGAAVMAR